MLFHPEYFIDQSEGLVPSTELETTLLMSNDLHTEFIQFATRLNTELELYEQRYIATAGKNTLNEIHSFTREYETIFSHVNKLLPLVHEAEELYSGQLCMNAAEQQRTVRFIHLKILQKEIFKLCLKMKKYTADWEKAKARFS